MQDMGALHTGNVTGIQREYSQQACIGQLGFTEAADGGSDAMALIAAPHRL